MKTSKVLLWSALGLAMTHSAHSSNYGHHYRSVVPDHQVNSPWYIEGEMTVKNKRFPQRPAKNVILFVGDGMGISTITAARIFAGQRMGNDGEENSLSWDSFPYSGMAKTYNVDAQTPDSAGTMTAIITGVKTDYGVIGVDENIVAQDCSTEAGTELVSALDLAELAGKATGVISTARITHATPASTYAKSAYRNWEDISDMPQDAVDGGCVDIALQLVEYEERLEARFPKHRTNGLEVVMGGGRRHFIPKDEAYNSPDAVSSAEGDRSDGRDLISEWQAAYPDGSYVWDQAGFDAIDPNTTSRVFGLFNESHMRYEADRHNDISGEPSLTEMTAKAVDILDNNHKGFFLVVESGRIDHGHHAGSAYSALNETTEFANAVQAAVDSVDLRETLIIVTADHGHVFTLGAWGSKRGNPILGKVVNTADEVLLASDGLPYNTVAYSNGPGFRDLGDDATDPDSVYFDGVGPVTGRQDLTLVDTESVGFHQETLLPAGAESHGGEDVGIFSEGPGSYLVSGTNDQSIIFHVINQAADLENKAAKRAHRRWWWW